MVDFLRPMSTQANCVFAVPDREQLLPYFLHEPVCLSGVDDSTLLTAFLVDVKTVEANPVSPRARPVNAGIER